uniref:Uncharacterized protein n=1 Tax=Plectus sambesii TaxID=2011161 RepID=A0A914WHY1_9BILA
MNRLVVCCFFAAFVANSVNAKPLNFGPLQALIEQTKDGYDYEQIIPYAEAPIVYPDMIDGSVDDEMMRARRNPSAKRYACRFKFCRIFDA